MTLRRSHAQIAFFSLLMLVLAWGIPSASAQQQGASEPKIERFGNWAGRCQDVPTDENGGTQKVCNVFVDIRSEENKEVRILSVAIGEAAKEGQLGAVVMTPLGSVLPQGVAVKVDENEQFGGQYLFCRASGCEAHMGLSAEHIRQMRAGSEMKVGFIHVQGGKIEVPVSLTGISAALDWLDQQ